MAKYVPGSLNDLAVIRREIESLKRQIREANLPTKTQTYNTSAKISGETQDLTEVYRRLSVLETKASELETKVDKTQETAEKARLPIGAVLHMSSKKSPGLYGTWTYEGSYNIEMTDTELKTLHIYTRTT